jgi:hypothetical protein
MHVHLAYHYVCLPLALVWASRHHSLGKKRYTHGRKKKGGGLGEA